MPVQCPSKYRDALARSGPWGIFVAGLFVCLVGLAAEPPQAAAPRVRTPWTTSRVVGSPDPPPPFKVVRAFPNLKFEKSGAHRALSRQRPAVRRRAGGRALFVRQRARTPRPTCFATCEGDQNDSPASWRQAGRGASTGWRFIRTSSTNRQCFVCYTLHGERRPRTEPGGRHARVAVYGHQGRPAADRSGERGNRLHLSSGRPQRRRPAFRPRRHALHLDRRRGQSQSARPVQHGAGHLRPPLLDPADRRGPQGRRTRTTPSPRTTRSSPCPGPGRKSGPTAFAIRGG